jgi:GT2 family glycosyltransferase
MQNSFSWKLTSPIRLFRRVLIDRISKVKRLPKQFTLVSDQEEDYNRWVLLYDKINEKRLDLFKKQAFDLGAEILFSIIIPVYNPPIKFLKRAIESVLKQTYEKWELCISDDCSKDPKVISFLKDLSISDPRIKVSFRKKNGHISVCSNSALDLSTGEYVVLLDHDDELRPHSLLRFAQNIKRNPKFQFIYSDEDKINEENTRFEPYFKPDWNPDLLLSQNYICHLACIKRSLIFQNGGFRVGYEGSQDWDLFLRVTENLKPCEIFHIPEILYHWRSYPASTASSLESKDYAIHAAKKSLNDYLLRNNINGKIAKLNEKANYWKIVYNVPSKVPLVSIIIPTKDQMEILKVCVESIISKTEYSNYEILVVDNGTTDPKSKSYLDELNKKSEVKVIKISGEFNYSRLNNSAAKHAKGEILLLLNNDIEVLGENWLEIMVSHAVRSEIGCVGAKLLYPNSTIQHAGVILGIGGVAGHPYKGFAANAPGQFSRLFITQNFEAVTGACLAVRKSIFEDVGGLNEKDLKVAFNDVDFCLRVRELGYNNILDPNVVLFHHESYSRGLDTEGKKRIRFEEEVKYMYRKWGKKLQNDSYYNPNLSLVKEDFSLAFPPRVS